MPLGQCTGFIFHVFAGGVWGGNFKVVEDRDDDLAFEIVRREKWDKIWQKIAIVSI